MGPDELHQKCGMDGATYLRFQQILLYSLMLLTLVCVPSLVPANWYGGENEEGIDRTQASNIEPEEQILWLHGGMTLLVLR